MRYAFVLALVVLSLWAAALASNLHGSRWVLVTVLSGVLFFGAIVALINVENRPRRNR